VIPGNAADAMHIVGGYGDIALRDFGLLLGALTLSRLARTQGRTLDV
jgi:hypothetical protein